MLLRDFAGGTEMVKCRDCYHTDKHSEKKDIRGTPWGVVR